MRCRQAKYLGDLHEPDRSRQQNVQHPTHTAIEDIEYCGNHALGLLALVLGVDAGSRMSRGSVPNILPNVRVDEYSGYLHPRLGGPLILSVSSM